MKPLPPLKSALWLTVAALAAAAIGLGGLRLARSMRRGRGAAFSLSRLPGGAARALSVDLLARRGEARWSGPSADAAWEALAGCGGPAPRRAETRLAYMTFLEGKKPVCRRALHLAAGGAAEFSLVVPEGAVLAFDVGARAASAGFLDAGVRLTVPGQPAEDLDVRRDTFTASRLDAGWRHADVDLSRWAGRSVTLRWSAAFQPAPGVASSSAAAHAFWASAALWTPAPPEPARAAGFPRHEARPVRNVVWIVFESFPLPSLQGLSVDDFPGLGLLAREGAEFQQVYGNAPGGAEGLRRVLTSRGPDLSAAGPHPSKNAEVAWPALMEKAGYRAVLFGAPGGDPGEWGALGFQEAHAAPPAGAGGEAALAEAARWLAQNGRSGPAALMVFVRAPLRGEDPSPRCWARAARLSPLSFFSEGRGRAIAQAVQTDGALGRLWNQKLRLGDEDRTLFIVNSLRGPSFRPEPLRRLSDGRLIRRRVTDPGLGLREEEVRSLWILRAPNLPAGRKVTAPAQLLDAAPTALDLAGLPPEPSWTGRSFAHPDAKPKAADEGARFLVEGAGGQALILDGHYKYIRRGPPHEVKTDGNVRARTDFDPEELYDLWTDPGEERNLARRRRDLLARARRAVGEWAPERTVTRLVIQGYVDPPLQGKLNCPGGELWNVSLSTGTLTRGWTSEADFTVSAPEAVFSFETWPPPAHFTLSLRSGGHMVPPEAFVISKLAVPLAEEESWNEWFDRAKFPWMEGLPEVSPAGAERRILWGRRPAPGDKP